MTDNELKAIFEEFKDVLSKGISKGFSDIPKTDSSGKNIGDYSKTINQKARNRYNSNRREAERQDAIQELEDRIKVIEKGDYGNTKGGKRKIKEYRQQQDKLKNGISPAEERAIQAKRTASIINVITQIGTAVVDGIVAIGERNLAVKRAEVEKNAKLIEIGLKSQGSIMQFGMKGITDGFTKNAHEMAYEATKGGYDLAKTMTDTSMQMTIASKTYAKDVKAANVALTGSLIASSVAIGAAIGSVIPGLGTAAGAAVGVAIGAIGGFVSTAWNKIMGLDIKKRELDIKIAEQVSNTAGQYQDTFKQLASGWDDLYKSTSDMVLKINDAGIKFGRTVGFGGDEFANTMLKLANTNVSGNKSLARIFGDEVDKIPEYMASYMDASSRNVGMNATDLGNIMGTGRLFGMSGQESAGLYGAMNVFNTSISSASDSMGVMYHQITKMGLSSKKFGKDLVQNLKMAEKYNFKGGVDNMMKLTKWAQQTRFNLNSAASFADSIMNDSLSGALEKSAKLQVLGGSAAIYSDPLGMLYDAGADVGNMAQRMAGMFNDITGTFNKKTGETEFSWYENRMLASRAQALGMDPGEVKNMIRQNQKQGVIDKVLRGSGLNEEDRLAIGNRATYNKKKGIWEVTDIKGNTHDIRDYGKAGGPDINDLLPADTQESILEVNQRSLSHLENMDGSTKAIATKLGVTEQDEIQARVDRETEKKEKYYNENWDKALAAFETAGQHSEEMFNKQITIMEHVANNLDTLKNIYAGIEKQVDELITTQFNEVKEAAANFAEGTGKYIEYINGIVEPGSTISNEQRKHTNSTWTRGDFDTWEETDKKTGKRYKYRVTKGGKNRKTQQYINDEWVDEQEDGYGSTNGGMILGASNVKSIRDGAVNIKTSSRDQYLAAETGGPIDILLKQILPGLAMLVNGNSNGSSKDVNVNFGGKIDLAQDGSTVNLVDIIKNNPAMANNFIVALQKAMEINTSGKSTYSYKF